MWMGTKHTRPVSSFGVPSFCAPAFGVIYLTDDKIAMAADSRGELDTVNDFGSLSSSVFARRRLLPQALLVRNDRGVPPSRGSECRPRRHAVGCRWQPVHHALGEGHCGHRFTAG